ncbi:MAG: DsbA family oxidoreductase [Rhizobiales bacterium]|nr:DsbA family oxidoreductase [Hyphomicrobiales bacterium]
MPTPLTIDVVSDVVCPRCYVGKRRLEAALALRKDITPEIRWRPFFLDPTVPRAGKPRIDYITGKFGGVDKITPAHERLVGIGKAVGIDFNFAGIEVQPNSLDAHRLISWAQAEGKADALVENLFAGFFVNGVNLADRASLAAAAARAGMDAAAVSADLASDKDEEIVAKQAQAASASGIGGVPFFVFGGKVAVSGAQESEVISSAMDQALAASA